MNTAINPPGYPVHPFYSQAVEAREASRTLYVAGQVGVGPDGTIPNDIGGQTSNALANLVNVHQTMFICWGAQAALHLFHGVKRYRMEHKAFGVFRHKIVKLGTPWLRGFSDIPMVPVSRYNDIDRTSLGDNLEILIDNDEIAEQETTLAYEELPLDDETKTKVKAGARFPIVVTSEITSRTAKVGDSREKLTEEHLAVFREKYADMIRALGYEVR